MDTPLPGAEVADREQVRRFSRAGGVGSVGGGGLRACACGGREGFRAGIGGGADAVARANNNEERGGEGCGEEKRALEAHSGKRHSGREQKEKRGPCRRPAAAEEIPAAATHQTGASKVMSDSRFAGAELDQGWLEACFARTFYMRGALVTPFLGW